MRSKEFTINIPINIRIDGEGAPQISTGDEKPSKDEPIDDNVAEYVPPLQKQIELMKKSQGVDSVYTPGDDEEGEPREIGSNAGPLDLDIADGVIASPSGEAADDSSDLLNRAVDLQDQYDALMAEFAKNDKKK